MPDRITDIDRARDAIRRETSAEGRRRMASGPPAHEPPPLSEARWRWRNLPLPEPHLVGLSVGMLAHIVAPLGLFPAPWVGHALGWPLTLAGLVVALWAMTAAGRMDMEKPDQLLSTGPYSHSRNPMYLAWTLMYIGIALVVDTAWPLIALPVVLVWTHLTVLREERLLRQRFGAEFERYRSRVSRYAWR